MLKINFLLFLITLFLVLTIPTNASLWDSFSDSWDYLEQSYNSFFGKELYSPHVGPNFNPRPFTVPLVYKLGGSNPEKIILIQKVVHALSTFFLVYSILLFISKTAVKYIIMISIYMLMSWWNIVGWTIVLLSESLSLSFLFLWIASFLLFLKKKNTFSLVLHMIITCLFAFTRDTWPYLIAAFYLLTMSVFYFSDKTLIKKNILLLLFGISLLFVQQLTLKNANRYQINLVNTIAIRILPNIQYVHWFENHGMPVANKLRNALIGIDNNKNRAQLYKLYKDPAYQAFFDWVNKDGIGVYLSFLITHPSYAFLFNENKEQLQRIFAYNLFYTGEINGYSQVVHNILPLFNGYIVLLLISLLVFAFVKTKKEILLLPALIFIIFTLNVFLSYNADAFEVERHLIVTNIMIQFLGFFSTALLLDLIDYKKQRILFSKKIFICVPDK